MFLANLMTPRKYQIVSEADYYQLYAAIDQEKRLPRSRPRRIRKMRDFLRAINIYPIRWMPVDVITINSVFELTRPDGSTWTAQLVYRNQPAGKARRISIFSSLGLSLLGRRTGESVAKDRLRVGRIIYQPELYNDVYL